MDEEQKKEHHRTYTYHFFFIHGLFDEIQHIKDLIQSIDKYLNENFLKKSEPEQTFKNLDPVFNTENQMGNVFPRILWKSAFLHAYFLTEYSLDQICVNIQIAENLNLSITDINGNGINRAYTYLSKVYNVNTAFKSKAWQDLLEFNKIRNILVHADGIININNKELLNIIKKYPVLTAPNFGTYEFSEIYLNKEFCIYAIETIDIFFQNIHRNLNELKRGEMQS